MKKQISLHPDDIAALQKQFFHSLTLGTGRTMLLMKAYPAVDFSKELIVAAAKNLANDPQCEGSRADYLFRLIKRSRQKDLIANVVLQKLKTRKRGENDLSQLCDLAVLLYKDGIVRAKEVLIQRFEKSFHADFDACGEFQVLQLEGLQGLFRIAEHIGKLPADERENWENRWLVENFQEENKSLNVFSELSEAAKNNPFIQNYLELIGGFKPLTSSPRIKMSPYTVNEVEEIIHNQRPRAFFNRVRVQKMTVAEIEQVARNFLETRDDAKKFKYLRFFYATEFPFSYAPLLKIARGKIDFQTCAVQNAVLALSHLNGAEIRALALKKFTTVRIPWVYLRLLVSNYQHGDADMLLEIMSRSKNPDELHLFVSGLIAIYEANPGADCKAPLELMYHNMNCALHRRELVELLFENGVLSDEILPELAYDSEDRIRKFYRYVQRERARLKATNHA